MQLLVSIHDVAPPWQAEAAQLWEVCREYAITPALLVVPNWHGEAPIREFPDFTAWARRCRREGSDILLHGERHDEAGLGRSVGDHLAALGRTAGEGEFLTLRSREALQRMQRGVVSLTAQGLPPVGFVPPAWLAQPGLARVARMAGLLVTEDVSRLWLTRRRATLASPVVRWSARSRWRVQASCAVATARAVTVARAAILRVALHPGDAHAPAVLASIRRVLDRECGRRLATTYGRLAVPDTLEVAA